MPPLAALCKASGDPLRLQILRVLRSDSFNVSELCELLDIRQPSLSHHLKILSEAGLITRRREGNTLFYRRSPLYTEPALRDLQQALFATVDKLTLPLAVDTRLHQLHTQRGLSSQAFFAENARKFRAQQDLIAHYDHYAGTVADVLNRYQLPQHRTALEVGPGDGAFLIELSQRFEQITALDNALSMLEKARARANDAGLDNIRFIHGDTRCQALQGLQADCIVVNMVLHHTPSPADVFQDLAGLLSPSGLLIVTDLCRHQQDWARDNCGDLWLGFAPADLDNWAARAELNKQASLYLAQRNGFQIQVRLYGRALVEQ